MLIYGGLIFCNIFFLFIGRFIFLYPGKTMEYQKKFYEKINWKIEPISIRKGLHNTRVMGLLIFILTLISIIYSFIMLMRL